MFFDDLYSSYEAERDEQRWQLSFPKLHVLYFRKGKNPKTGEEQWQVRFKSANSATVYVPHEEGSQPTSDQQVWLCQQGKTIFEREDQTFEVVSVRLMEKLFEGEIRLRFRLDEKRLIDGKHPWNGHLPLNSQRSLTVLCTPDKFGQLPTQDRQFWVCRFKKAAHLNKRGDFIIAVVELLREDLEAKERYEQGLHVEAVRKAAEALEQKRQHEVFMAEMAERRKKREQSDVEIQPSRAVRKMPGRGCVATCRR